MSLVFEWDENKARINQIKHSVSLDEAKTVFKYPLARISFDKEHSRYENRWHIIGNSICNRIIITANTERNNRIRIISARKAESSERKNYEKYDIL